jgi:S-DNA-T family DNA segregation ATPase FtsK/SpoIIIE
MARKKPVKKTKPASRKGTRLAATMTRKPAAKNDKPKARKKSGGQGGGGFFRFLFGTPMRQILMVVIIIALVIIFWGDIETSIESGVHLFGWGLVFIIAVALTLFILGWRRRLGLLIYRWNRWLGVIAYALAAWGIMATIDGTNNLFVNGQGGSFGRGVIGYPDAAYVYVLRVIALIIIGTLFIAPRPSFRAIKRSYFWLLDNFKRPAKRPPKRVIARPPAATAGQSPVVTRTPVGEKPPLPAEMNQPLVAPEVTRSQNKLKELAARAAALRPGAHKPVATTTTTVVTQPQGLKQVAADVWKKYGQTPTGIVVDGWNLPTTDILDMTPEVSFSEADNQQRKKLIEDSLASYGVDARVVQINTGPTVTQFGVEPGWDIKYREIKEKDPDGNVTIRREEISRTRVKVERISSLANDLALALAAPTIRIEAPVPGKSIVGIEVPNTTSDMVSLRGVVETSTFQKLVTKTKMALALGKGAGGEAVAGDLTKMPHLLIAGATGSGKTVCLNTVICCLLLHNTPYDIRFILVDPNRVELTQYNSVPHLAVPVIVDTSKSLGALRWLCQEMDQRYQKLAAAGARHIEGYNKNKHGSEKLPYLVLIIDELADLMMAGFDEVEANLCRLAQLARATGIHLVVATQRPSVDVVTGLIKANFPTRISFAVTSQVDSRTILDGAGAEKLLGRGDMLYMPTEAAKPKRLQGCFLSDAEIERLVYFWGSQKGEGPDKLKMETLIATTPAGTIGGHPRDPLLEQAKELSRQYNDVSTSFLQRKLHIGYPRAARLKEQLDAVLSEEISGEQVNEETMDSNGEGNDSGLSAV